MTPILFYDHGLDSVWPWRKDDLAMARKTIAHGHSHDIGAGNALWAKNYVREWSLVRGGLRVARAVKKLLKSIDKEAKSYLVWVVHPIHKENRIRDSLTP